MGGESNNMLQRAVQKLLSAPLLPPLPLLLGGSLFFFFLSISLLLERKVLKQRESKQPLHAGVCDKPFVRNQQFPREVGEDTYFGSILHMQFVPVIILITAQVTQDFTKHTATN